MVSTLGLKPNLALSDTLRGLSYHTITLWGPLRPFWHNSPLIFGVHIFVVRTREIISEIKSGLTGSIDWLASLAGGQSPLLLSQPPRCGGSSSPADESWKKRKKMFLTFWFFDVEINMTNLIFEIVFHSWMFNKYSLIFKIF